MSFLESESLVVYIKKLIYTLKHDYHATTSCSNNSMIFCILNNDIYHAKNIWNIFFIKGFESSYLIFKERLNCVAAKMKFLTTILVSVLMSACNTLGKMYHIKPSSMDRCPVRNCITLSKIRKWHLNRNSTLQFLPGVHILDSDFSCRYLDRLIMISNHSFHKSI